MSGHLVIGVGPGLAICGHPGVGSCRRGKLLFGCRVTGCAEREAGCGSQATGSKPTEYSFIAAESQYDVSGCGASRSRWVADCVRFGRRTSSRE
jgi:hypothetical protein